MGTNILPIFTDVQLDFIAAKLDDVTFKKGFMDAIDQPVYRLSLGMLSKAFSDDVPDDIKDGIQAAFDELIEADYAGAGAEAIQEVIEQVEKLEFKVKDLVLGVLAILKVAIASLDQPEPVA